MERRSFLTGVIAMLTTTALPKQDPDDAAGKAEPEVTLTLKPGEMDIRPAFETCSYYFRPQGDPATPCRVEFRAAGEERWQPAIDPVSDKPAGIWKGSVFGLREDSAWELRVSADGKVVAQGEFRTWSSHPPVAKTIDLSTLPVERFEQGLVISDHGKPDAWIKYTAPEGWILRRKYDINDPQDAVITFKDAQYVLLENVTIAGGRRYAIEVEDCDSVRILNCDLSGWGRVGVQQFTNDGMRGKYLDPKGEMINLDAGIEIDRSARTVVERCYIHDPRHRANSWMFSHPSGPCAIHVNYNRGGTVLRWNDMIGSDEHRWNDVIESSANSSPTGGFFRDSDITGNYLAFGNDDGVELEGGGMNVRFYGNRVEGTTCGVSTGACILGPQYVFHNLLANPGDESGLALMFFKNSHRVEQGGRRYFVGNTLYGFTCSAYGAYGSNTNALKKRIGFMRNNVFSCNGARLPGEWGKRDDFDNDLFHVNGSLEASRHFLSGFQGIEQERHGLAADPRLKDPARGDYHLAADSPARGQAVAVANLTPEGADPGAFARYEELPYRPLALLAEPREIQFPEPGKNSKTEVRLSLPASAKQSVAFRIRQNRVFDWFHVEPSAGELKPGKTLTLTVALDTKRLTGRPLFKGAFLIRTPEGLSRPISVYAVGEFTEPLHPNDAPNSVYVEAASLAGVEKFVGTTDAPNVAGGRYVALNGAAHEPGLDIPFEIATLGRYSLLARAGIGDDVMGGRAFEITLDNASPPVNASLSADYQWNTGDNRFRVVYLSALGDLAPGNHHLRIRSIKGEIKLNQLIITDNPASFFVQHWQRERAPEQGA